MNRDNDIVERLERIEDLLAPLAASAHSMQELRAEIAPRINEGIKALIGELAEIDGDLQLDDLLYSLKKMARSVRTLTVSLEYLNSAVDFIQTAEPLLRTAVPHAIEVLDELEQNKVFELFNILLLVLREAGKNLKGHDVELLESSMMRIGSVAGQLLDPGALAFLEHALSIPAYVDLAQARDAGPMSLLKDMRDKRTLRGLSVLMQIARAMDPERGQPK